MSESDVFEIGGLCREITIEVKAPKASILEILRGLTGDGEVELTSDWDEEHYKIPPEQLCRSTIPYWRGQMQVAFDNLTHGATVAAMSNLRLLIRDMDTVMDNIAEKSEADE